tara:strand:- start:349 stop:1320 length:972 start_codon:yes stop_codon:yes gene_type:complete
MNNLKKRFFFTFLLSIFCSDFITLRIFAANNISTALSENMCWYMSQYPDFDIAFKYAQTPILAGMGDKTPPYVIQNALFLSKYFVGNSSTTIFGWTGTDDEYIIMMRETTRKILKLCPQYIPSRDRKVLENAIKDYDSQNIPKSTKEKSSIEKSKNTEKTTIQEKNETAQSYYEKGIKEYESNNFSNAINYFTKVLEMDYEYIDITLFMRGLANKELNNFSEAIDDFTKTLRIDPNFGRALYERGRAKYESKKFTEAIVDFTEALKIEPSSESALYERGRAKYESKNYNSACKDFEKLISLGIVVEKKYFTFCKIIEGFKSPE